MTETKLNVYQKLQKCRIDFQSKKVKKSGVNKFSGYQYFELSDILPIINELFEQYKLCSVISFDKELATLTIYDTEAPISTAAITITSPMAEANLKGCHPVQNLGAVETYQRRYLYMVALEIVESDVLDSTHNPNEALNKKTGEIKGYPTIKRRMKSKLKEVSTCYYCGKKHINPEQEIVCVEIEGKDHWGAEDCYKKHIDSRQKQDNNVQDDYPLDEPPPPSDENLPF
jgi:hypothetical protein